MFSPGSWDLIEGSGDGVTVTTTRDQAGSHYNNWAQLTYPNSAGAHFVSGYIPVPPTAEEVKIK